MCRIDAPFGDRDLNEKTELSDRFSQALDEHAVEGCFRVLLTKHFADNWSRYFCNVDKLDEALASTQHYASDSEKCVAFLTSDTIISRLRSEIQTRKIDLQVGVPHRNYPHLNFAIEVARSLFPQSAYALFTSGLGDALGHPYPWFVATFYGEDYCLSQAFFDDEALASEGESERYRVLTGFFHVLSQQVALPRNKSAINLDPEIQELISKGRFQADPGRPISCPHAFLDGLEFLKAWMMSDAQAGRLEIDGQILPEKLDQDWYWDLLLYLPSRNSAQKSSNEAIHVAEKWLREMRYKLYAVFFRYADLSSASDSEREGWAAGLDDLCDKYGFECLDCNLPNDAYKARIHQYLIETCSRLTPLQLEIWIQWTVDQDFQEVLSTELQPWSNNLKRGEKWWDTPHATLYKERLDSALGRLEAEAKLKVLTSRLPFSSEASHRQHMGWWDDLLFDPIKNNDVPKELIPHWAKVAKYRSLDYETLVPFIDKAVGILRGRLSRAGMPEDHQLLAELLPMLDKFEPTKALRHRLMLMRSSLRPFTDKALSRSGSFSDDKDRLEWDRPLRELAKERAARMNSKPGASREEREHVEVESLAVFSRELADFCLGRLRLRKGEKTDKGSQYDEHQVIESSSTWRQGYLKALAEIGLDLGGKVHKTVYFTKQCDPDESVRAIASECYKSVRRHSKSSPSRSDLKRGIIAAEWWLLMCQRRELGVEIDHEEALKTRRRLLRNP